MDEVSVEDLLATPPVSSATLPRPPVEQLRSTLQVAPPLVVDVVWGHLARVPADIHVTGHYVGVMPTAAERALDAAISVPGGRQIIAEHTRRRWLVGALGEVAYFPGSSGGRADGSVVVRAGVVGMGRVGTFSRANAVRLYASLVRELAGLACVEHAVTVPVGAGAGNLTMEQVAEAIVVGCGEGLAGMPPEDRRLRRVTVVEFDRLRAERLLGALRAALPGDERVQVVPEIGTAPGGGLGSDAAVLYLVRTLLGRLTAHPEDEATERLLADVRADLPEDLWAEVRKGLSAVSAAPGDVVDVRLRPPRRPPGALPRPEQAQENPVPTRITALQPTEAGGVTWSALTARATVPEREVRLDRDLLAQLVRRLTAPNDRDARELPTFLTRFLVPLDLQVYLGGEAPLVIEVDARTARVPWEFLMPAAPDARDTDEPLAVRQCFARQMRTSYARTDIDAPAPQEMHALVIGDPGSGKLGLPGARAEALAVADVLQRHGITVEAYVGSADDPQDGVLPATRLDVLAKVLTGRYDVIHYAGHGVFDPANPELSGWLFADGLLTARELTQLSRAPWLVMANACWSAARPKERGDGPAGAAPPPGRQGELAPVLADEFLRVGVGHFVGASWRVPDDTARDFAVSVYQHLLGQRGHRESLGRALQRARRELWEAFRDVPDAARERRNAWAAYQHYGDPGDGLRSRVLDDGTETGSGEAGSGEAGGAGTDGAAADRTGTNSGETRS